MIFTKILGFLSILLVGFVETFVLPPLAVTKYGFVLGTKRVLPSGKQVDFFQKVPFAKPPIGNLRFEKPVPPDPWGFVNSSSPIVSCVQFSGSTAGSEDCLYMTIARPEVPSLNGGYPVMVHIFGGGFITGSSSSYNSVDANDRFVTQGIILVTFNYRLGPLGFYTTGDSNALGNYGIWDQIRALEFIQETIRGFGGNPNKVTVFGNSAGGLSATWLSYSPHSKGLFQRIIPYCGTCQSGMAFSQHTLKYSKQLEETLGCGTVQDKKSCLKTKNLTEILLAGKFPWMVVPDDLDLVFYSPRFDGEILVGNNFREAIVKAPKIDSLIGINSNEAIAFAVNALNRYSMNATYAPVQKDKQATFNQTNLEAAFKFLLSQNNAFQPNPETPIQEIIDFYLQQKPKFPNYPDLNAFVQLFSDVGYNVPVVREAKFKASHGRKIYVYMNDYEIPNNPIKSQYLVGNSHCAENTMIFGNTSGFEPPIVGKYKQVMENFVQMWISFIKFGIPKFGNMTLEKATPNRVPFAHILNDTRLENDLWADRSSFWDHIARTYGFDWIFGRPTSWNL